MRNRRKMETVRIRKANATTEKEKVWNSKDEFNLNVFCTG